MDDARIDNLIATYRDGLLEDTVPFWCSHSVDREHGGFMMAVDRDGTVIDTDKGVWQQGRFTWLLGELYNNVEPRDEWLELAQHGAQFLTRHCIDPTDGRMWFHVTRDGKPIRKRRYSYSESFAAIAFGELAQATGDDSYSELAERAFRQFISHNQNPQGVQPKFTDTRPMKSVGFPMITIVTAQELRDSIGLADADEWIARSIDVIRRHHMNYDLECLLESVGTNGKFIDHFDGRMLNPGHAIEAAWFFMREGELQNDRKLIRDGCQILDWSWDRGWDKQFGGILYFVDVRQLPVQEYWHDMKFWWPQNEAIIATLLAYYLTGDPKYAEWHQMIHDWAYRYFPDREHGEWYGYLHRNGEISSRAKGNLWKGAFHLPRMQLVCWQTLLKLRDKRKQSESMASVAKA